MPKKIIEHPMLPLLTKYTNDIKKGRYRQPNGKLIKESSVQNYFYMQRLLCDFSTKKGFQLRIKIIDPKGKSLFEAEKKYWKEFYKRFTDYLYDDLEHFDNYVVSTGYANCSLLKKPTGLFLYLPSGRQAIGPDTSQVFNK